ncbi:MAG: response regulator transcription factor [Nitriliruptorales bacterium]|nr:response regulator transcription factor [Nitriliruptorales bacterium]
MAEAGSTLLLVEDDEGIARPLATALEGAGYDVRHAAAGTEALRLLDGGIAAVILDLGLPDIDGVELCRRIRREHGPDLPILILTARGSETDVVVGLDAGADDYVTKPFRLAELQARLRALLRRTEHAGDTVDRLAAQDVHIEPGPRRAYQGGDELELTPTEFDLLVVLLQRAGDAVPRDRIMTEVWGKNWYGSSKTLDMHISALRKKLDDDPSQPRYISTVRGVGFRFETEAP